MHAITQNSANTIRNNLLKFIILFICSFIFIITTIYFINPTAIFPVTSHSYAINEIIQNDSNENAEAYITNQDGYLKLIIHSSMNYNMVRISFLEANNATVTLEKTSEHETICLTQYATNRNPVLQFKTAGSANDVIYVTIQSTPNTVIALNSVQTEYTMISTNVYLWGIIIICSLLCEIVLFLFFRNGNSTAQNTSKRDTNIELCRIICMLFVVLHHYAIHGGSFNLPVLNTNRIYSLFLIPGGKLGFDCFLAISCWFLVDQEFRTKRFIKMWLLVWFYSVTFSIITFLMGGYFTFENWFSIFLPISGNSHGFASAYLSLYLLLPFLAKMTDKLTKYQARWLMILLFFFEVITQLVGAYTHYYQKLASELLVFILCYVIALNLKRWPLKITQNKHVMLTVFISIWLLLWLLQYSYVKHPENQLLAYLKGTMEDESSISNLLGGFAFFLFFKNIKMKHNWFINTLATGTFGILLIHDHNFFRYVFWDKVIHTPDLYYSSNLIPHSIIAALWIFIMGFVIDKLREFCLERNILKSKLLNQICGNCDNIIYPSINEATGNGKNESK